MFTPLPAGSPSGDDKTWRTMQDRAGKFLDAMWNEQQGHFYVGSLPGSDRPNLTQSGIDSELWPILAVPEFRGRAERDAGMGRPALCGRGRL